MVSDKAKEYLRKVYGDKYFGWDISDHHLKEILSEKPEDYTELDEKCTSLENCIREIKDMLEQMKGEINAR